MPSLLDYREPNPYAEVFSKRQKEQDDDEAKAEMERQRVATALAREKHLQRNDASDALARTMASDVGQSVADKAYRGVPFRDLAQKDPDFQQSLMTRYGGGDGIPGVADKIAPAWDAAQTAYTGGIPGLESLGVTGTQTDETGKTTTTRRLPEVAPRTGAIGEKDMGEVGLDAATIPREQWSKAYAEANTQKAKASIRPTAEMQKKIQNAAVIIKDLGILTEAWKKSPDYGMLDRAAASRVQNPSKGFFDGITRSLAAKWATDDLEELGALTNRVNGLISFAQGGSSLTPSEQKAMSVIDITDEKPVALRKLATAIPLIRKEMASQIAQYPGVFPELEKVLAETDAPSAPAAKTGVEIITKAGKRYEVNHETKAVRLLP